MKKPKSTLWFAVFFTLPVLFFVAIYGIDYFLERTYYNTVAVNGISFFSKWFFSCAFFGGQCSLK